MKNKKKILFIAGLCIIGILVILFISKNDGRIESTSLTERSGEISERNSVSQGENKNISSYEKQVEALKTAPLTKADIEEPLYKGSKEKFKVFKIKAMANGYEPNGIIVEKGDSVQFNMFAEQDTDIESKDFKLFLMLPAGKITNFGFLLNQEGTYTFYCRNQCLGKERIFGHIVVRPRS